MVEKAKKAGKDTKKFIDEVVEFATYAALIAASIKLFTQPAVHMNINLPLIGNELPIWQAVAAILLVVVVLQVRSNRSK